ncbi:hypothetical protein B0T19DRAFT_438706 [Cercophora scortea]|uniref:SMB domain-containing protein n=1 Tax=Cercophora scortea TaxID=314031 RepID=A0AAE0IV25_9PEZI|nr:hypothetical protein B0T19DRAFT_438706 [Cercophora scortea]
MHFPNLLLALTTLVAPVLAGNCGAIDGMGIFGGSRKGSSGCLTLSRSGEGKCCKPNSNCESCNDNYSECCAES